MQNNKTMNMEHRTIRHVRSTKAFENLRDNWNSLLEKNHVRSAVLTWEWLFSWWTVFGEDKKLWIITVWEEETLLGIAPLMLEKRRKFGVPLQVLCTLGTPMNDIGGFIIKDQDVQTLDMINNFILEQKAAWDIYELNEFQTGSFEIDAVRDVFNHNHFHRKVTNNEHYYVPATKSWDEYYKTLSKKFRKNLRRAERNSESLGEVSFEQYANNSLNWEKFRDAIAVNCHANYPRICNSEQEKVFLKKLFDLAPERFVLYLLYANNEAVAYEYGFIYQNRFEDWRAGFDTRIDPTISIGKFIALKVLKKSFENNLDEIDFMRGSHDYKKEWQPESRVFVQLRFFKRESLKAKIAYMGLEKIKPLLKQ